ncbi:MAG: M14 family zinc carboxypeptidase [Christensenellales bacterium]|jgi:g-D-glutamyl-meso-diaminopimelate peptidase|nr:hypothetical protein [Clostridiales bacterium]
MINYREIEKLLDETGGRVSYVGVTHLGNPIPMVTKGNGANGVSILLVGSVHAREYITSYLLCGLLKDYEGQTRIDCVPVLNIDGVFLCRNGARLFPPNSKTLEELIYLNGGCDFSLWKANIRGVDINVNFDADWGKGELNTKTPGSENYIGPYPESENETKAAVELLRKNNYNMVVAYHSKGEEIFYGYGDDLRYKEHSLRVADFLGYRLKTSDNSAGGLKDYVVKQLKGYALTIEVGEDRFEHPYPMEELSALLKKHKGSLELFCDIGEKIAGRVYEGSHKAGPKS